MQLTIAEENYLKFIYSKSRNNDIFVNTTDISTNFNIAASSVTDMFKKLKAKKLIKYEPYKGVLLTKSALHKVKQLIRRHRLWEVFLSQKLGFGWDEVHDIAEELEHISSLKLINKLDEYLSFPQFDPHGDPIPNVEGVMPEMKLIPLSKIPLKSKFTINAVCNQQASFLSELAKMKIAIGAKGCIIDKNNFDESIYVLLQSSKHIYLSKQMSENILVKI